MVPGKLLMPERPTYLDNSRTRVRFCFIYCENKSWLTCVFDI